MSHKKIIFLISFLAVFGFLFNLNTPIAKAMTTAEIQTLIFQLQQQIAQLQKQLTEMESAPVAWCHDFNTNLRYADKGTEVEALQTVLTKEGFDVSGDHSGSFEDYTASAVVGFQEKYKQEILSPLGLLHGTGFVGKSTRAKLNTLYGCGAVTSTPTPTTPTTQIPVTPKTTIEPNIQVTSPVGLERWVIGNTYEIKWKSYGVSKVDIQLVGADEKKSLASGFLTSEGEGKFSWKIEGVNPGQSWRIQIWSTEKPTVYAESPLLFMIVAAPTTTSSIIVISPNGGEHWTIGKYNTMKFSVISSTGGLIKADVKIINKDTNNEYKMGTFYVYPPETLISFLFSQNIPSGDHYILNVSSPDFGIAGDDSDSYFSISSAVTCQQETTGVTCGGFFYEDYCEKSTDGMVYAAKRKCSYSTGSDCSSLVATADRTLCPSGGCDKGICTGTLKEGEKPLTITSPNGGENLVIGNTYTIRWANPGSIRNLTVDLYRGGTRFTGLGGMRGAANYPAPTSSLWFTVSTADLVSGSDFKIRVWSSDDPTIYDESDNYFSIAAVIPSPATCNDLKSNSGTNYFFDLCKKGGCDRICFNKYYATYQGCGKSFEYDYCTVYNANADKNILCDTGLVYTCADSDNWKEYYKQGTVTDSGKTYTDYCVDNSTLKEYFCFASDSYLTGTVNEENYTCSSGCENGACKTIEKPRISVVTPNGGDRWIIGNAHSIQLSCSAGVSKPINIFLKDNRTESLPRTLFTGVTCNVGETSTYNWTVSSDVNPGENAFKIRIETADSLLIDESDNYFSVVSGGAGLKNIENQLASISAAISQLIESVKVLMGR